MRELGLGCLLLSVKDRAAVTQARERRAQGYVFRAPGEERQLCSSACRKGRADFQRHQVRDRAIYIYPVDATGMFTDVAGRRQLSS